LAFEEELWSLKRLIKKNFFHKISFSKKSKELH
jgi:hypothetical protein